MTLGKRQKLISPEKLEVQSLHYMTATQLIKRTCTEAAAIPPAMGVPWDLGLVWAESEAHQ